MRTDILTPSQIFQNPIRYTVPAFQRRYVWTQDDQWEPLWDDVRNTAESHLEELERPSAASATTVPHFLGAIVVQQIPDTTSVADIQTREVIDGQQRMTTIQLLLDAVQYVFENHDNPSLKRGSRRLSRLVSNDEDFIGYDKSEVFKLWPTTDDREAFKHAMHNGLATDEFESSLIVQAHEFFQLQVREWLNSDLDSIEQRAQALEVVLTRMLQMVVIDLTPTDDPHIIFETLNARGTPLEESELIKNYAMFRGSQIERNEAQQDDIWGDLSDDWWRREIRQGRLYRPRIDVLLNYWLVMQTTSEVSASRVFREFRRYADDRAIEDVMSEVLHDFTNYRRFLDTGPRTRDEAKFLYRVIRVMGLGAVTPVLLAILSLPDQSRNKVLRALESFLVRRMICRASTRGYPGITLDLVGALRDKSDEAISVVTGYLKNQTAESTFWPDDDTLSNALQTLPLYRMLTRGRLRLVLEGIEERIRESSMAEQISVPRNMAIEHVMPRSWGAGWPLPEGLMDHEREERRSNRNRVIHTIGNLTLTTRRLNSALSNAPWEQKRQTLAMHSILRLNHRLLAESNGKDWDEDFIQARSKRMAKLVAEVWPGPDSPGWDG